MAKIVKMNPQTQKEPKFEEFLKSLPKKDRAFLEEFNINSNEDMIAFFTASGIDVEKLLDYCDNHPDDDLKDMSIEQFMMDENHPLYHESILAEDDYEDDSLCLPERVFIGDKAMEYHIRIKLSDAPLPIWRELKVPSNITLEVLSLIILEAMGWKNIHLHKFKKGNTLFMDTEELEEQEYIMPFSRFQREDANNWSLSQVLFEKGDRMEYEYDFGDSWKHEIWVKGIREYTLDETPSIVLLKGKGACPPEDCGGVWGYAELLRIYTKKRKTKEEKEHLEWYWMDRNFNPETYNVKDNQYILDTLWAELTC